MLIFSDQLAATKDNLTAFRLRIYTFGTLQVVRGDHAVTESDWHTRQARQLLKILITERPRPVSTDRLIEILWPNSTPQAAATTLRSAINALRNVLEPDRRNRAPSEMIITVAPGYAFHSHSDLWLDVASFEQNLNQAERTQDLATRRHYLEAAVALYQDDYLTSDPYADWAQNERERLRERYFTALLQLAEIAASAGQSNVAITACRQILARDEVRENAYQALMRYQAEAGDSAGALLTYERCRTILAEELGADPSPLTQLWHQRILNGEVEPRLPDLHGTIYPPMGPTAPALPPAENTAPPAPLPQQAMLPFLDAHFADVFVGREAELAQLAERLHTALAGLGNLAVLEGEAGVGKTRLAYQLLQQAVEAGATVISTACQPLEHQLPFAPLADSIGRYLHALPDTHLRTLPPASLTQLTQIVPSLCDRLPDLPPLPSDIGTRSDENRQRLIDGIVAFLTALAYARPLVLFLDDLHWADADTLAVLSRLTQRLAAAPFFLLLAYRSDDHAENEALTTSLHTWRRAQRHQFVVVPRLNRTQVQHLVSLITGKQNQSSQELATALFTATSGNPLFVTEALRDLQERDLSPSPAANHAQPADWQKLTLHPSQRVQEIIIERIERLPAAAKDVLQLSAVISRDFSLELLETAAAADPMAGLETLLQRKFLVERPDERLELSHQVVRQVAYERMTTLQRRRLHSRVADALVTLGRAQQNPSETAFHYSQSGAHARLAFAHYSVLSGEKLLRTYGFRQAIEAFDQSLAVLEATSTSPPEAIGRALQGRGLAYESLFDPEGVTETYRRLQTWARSQGDHQLMLTAYSRLTSMLGLLGQQRESNELLRELMKTLHPLAAEGVIYDLYARRRLIYSPDEGETTEEWAVYTPPPAPVSDPVGDILLTVDRVHAVLPLLDYGWTLLVQGQLGEATRCLEAVVDLAQETGQPSIASTAYYQLAVTARILGHLEESQRLNEQSIAINREIQGAELGSLWPRIGSAFLALKQNRLDEAERRLRRVIDVLGERPTFRNHRNSAQIGLGLVALGGGDLANAQRLLEGALSDPVNLYPYTHVQALLGLARIAHLREDTVGSVALLRQALRFAGRRSLLEEYVDSVLAIAELKPANAPIGHLLQTTLRYVTSIGLEAASAHLRSVEKTWRSSL